MPLFRPEQVDILVQAVQRLARVPNAIVYQVILQEAAKLTLARGGSLFTFEHNGLVLRESLDQDHVPEVIPLPLRPGSAFESAIREREPLLVSDVEQHNQIKTSGWAGYNDGSLIILPMMDGNQNISAIISLHNKSEPPFVQADLDAARILATFAYEMIRAQKSALLLHQQKTFQRSLFEANPNALLVLNSNYQIVDANPRFFDMFGYRENQVLNQSFWWLLHQADQEKLKKFFHQTDNPKERTTFSVRSKNNQVRSVEGQVVKLSIREEPTFLVTFVL
ncbi:GAF domain-containing protein [Acanthopleuribacter pedis]|uniref:GAF domain-containing protein n=1 Tax=Acanthopleuribacter pedis TaxID=442870 RepID=A0A8J7QFZ9_9BACT|nr:GAF domain-containing protein [Acanthopleuribacter pedis]MBO1317873.1 GAF domain-containing protein [Acanthopleuribacter pedis]